MLSSVTLTINTVMTIINIDENQKQQNTIKGDQKNRCATVERLEGNNLENMQNKNRHRSKHETKTERIMRIREMMVGILVPYRFV